jgi:hypothetical protein
MSKRKFVIDYNKYEMRANDIRAKQDSAIARLREERAEVLGYSTASKKWGKVAKMAAKKKKATKKQVAPPTLPEGAERLAYVNPGSEGSSPCRNPNCPTCQRLRDEEAIVLPEFYSGQRVSVARVRPTGPVTATVINLSREDRPNDCIAVCLDSPVPEAEPQLERIAGHGHGWFALGEDVAVLTDQHSFDTFQRIPRHVGVTVVDGRKVDSINFKNGLTGRVVRQRGDPAGRVLVDWNFNNRYLYDGAKKDEGAGRDYLGMFTRCYNVPRNMVAYCRLDADGERAYMIWPNSDAQAKTENFKRGDYVRVTIADPQRVSNGIRNFRISAGAIMRYQGTVDHYKSEATLVGGCDPAILGTAAVISTKGLEKFKGDFFEAPAVVEIIADLSFRKRNLKGLSAIVVLPLDQDGDVGLQFEEDIGAGSLDGHGRDARCLYIHQSNLKKVSG